MQSVRISDSTKGLLFVMAGSLATSFGGLFVKWIDAGPSTIACYRMLWGSIPLLILAFFRGERILPEKSMGLIMVLAAFFFALDIISWHYSILYVGPGLATILSNLQVFFLALFGAVILKEKMGMRLKISIPLVLVCLWLVLDVRVGDINWTIGLGLITGLLSAFFYAAYVLTLRFSQTSGEKLSPLSTIGIITFFTAIFTGLSAVLSGESLVVHGLDNHLMLACCGLIAQGMGWVLLSQGLPYMTAARAGIVLMLQPTFTFIWDVALFDRPTSLLAWCGAAGALAAIAMGAMDKAAPAKETGK